MALGHGEGGMCRGMCRSVSGARDDPGGIISGFKKRVHAHARRRTHTHAHARVKLFAAPVNAPVMLSFDCDRHMYYYLYPPLVMTRSGRASEDRLGSCAKAFYHVPWGLLGSGAYRFRLSGVIPPMESATRHLHISVARPI